MCKTISWAAVGLHCCLQQINIKANWLCKIRNNVFWNLLQTFFFLFILSNDIATGRLWSKHETQRMASTICIWLAIPCCQLFHSMTFTKTFTALHAKWSITTLCTSSSGITWRLFLLFGGLGFEDQKKGLRVASCCGVRQRLTLSIKTKNTWCTRARDLRLFVAALLPF